MVGELSVGDATFDYDDMIYGFLDLKLKGEDNGFLENTPRVQYYTMGSNEWRSSDSWPPEDAEMVTYYLRSDGNANSLFGDGRLSIEAPGSDESSDAFTYDPLNPVKSHGGQFCCMGNAATPGSFDQRGSEARNDILVYTTDLLEQGVEVTGTVEVTLYVSSDARDTDFTVKLIDVYPDGRALNVDETIQRARYREGYETEVFMEDGQVYELPVSAMSTSNYFAPGHRIRIEVSSSNFPRFVRNLNTGGNNSDESEAVVAHNAVHHTTSYPSQIRLPIVH
jgi:putative CocE/NonD family hydrolase